MEQKLNLPDEPSMPDDPKGWKVTRLGAIAGREKILFARLCYDSDSPTPFEEGTANGQIYSRKYFESVSQEVLEDYLEEKNSVPVQINDYGSGGVRLYVTDQANANAVWVADEDALDNIGNVKGKARKAKLEEYAKGVLAYAEDWANGNVYGYQVECFDLITRPDGSAVERIEAYDFPGNQDAYDSCWVFVGDDGFKECRAQMLEAANSLARGLAV